MQNTTTPLEERITALEDRLNQAATAFLKLQAQATSQRQRIGALERRLRAAAKYAKAMEHRIDALDPNVGD